MKVLFVGLGSVGQRHLRNLIKLIPDAQIMAYRQNKSVPFLSESNTAFKNININDFYNIKLFDSYESALKAKPDLVFICNPSNLHFDYALDAIKSKICVFLEKPICTNLEEAKKLVELEKNIQNKKCMVGYQYRFNPVLLKVKEILNANKLGNIVRANLFNGEYLPYWHPYEDYTRSYAANKKQGGGAIFTQIHDLDYAIWLFGLPETVYAKGGKLSNLKLDAEDSVCLLTNFNFNDKLIPISFSIDLLSWPSKKTIDIVGDKGSLSADLSENKIILSDIKTKKQEIIDFSNITRNDIFISQMRHFLDFYHKKCPPLVDIYEAQKSLIFAFAAKQSLKEEKIIKINFN
tara:strand:- start:1204 stop:2247 length:1044 start_codon:yes stop_codon:yes gene_type:complete